MFNPFVGQPTAKVLSNVRENPETPAILTITPTNGCMRISEKTAKAIGAVTRNRVLIGQLPTQFSGTPVNLSSLGFTETLKNEEGEAVIIFLTKGINSNVDIFNDQFEDDAENAKLKVKDVKAFNEARRDFVAAKLAEAGEDATDALGNIISSPGSGYQFTTGTPWAILGGDLDKNIEYSISEPIVALAVVGEGADAEIVPVTSKTLANFDPQGYAMFRSDSTDPNRTFKYGTLADAINADVFVIPFDAKVQAKTVRVAGGAKAAKEGAGSTTSAFDALTAQTEFED